MDDMAGPVQAQGGPAGERPPRIPPEDADPVQAEDVAPARAPNEPNEVDDRAVWPAPEAQRDQANDPLIAPAARAEGQAADVAAVPVVNVNQDALHYAIVALLAFILGLMLVTLQVLGLRYAWSGIRTKDMTVNWCSPAFRDFAVAVTNGNCQKYAVLDSSSNGIGCISLPGSQQRDWLRGTIIALSVALACEVGDTVLMMCTTSETKWRAVKAQRPWCTMFGGVIMLVILIVKGWGNAGSLPKEMTETVWIYRKEASRALGRVCKGTLNPPGLRGVMIGYMDGLFQSWGSVYDGR